MSGEFIDTNVLIYAQDSTTPAKHEIAIALMDRLYGENRGALSVQVLSEFYSVATGKLGMKSEEAEAILEDLAGWTIHRPGHADLQRAARLHRRHKISWWDALIVHSATELGCSILWSENFTHGRKFGTLTVRNPFQ